MSDTDRSVRKPGSDTLLIVGGVASLLISWGLACVVIPKFASVFAGFGTELPWSTRFVLRYYPYGFVLSLLVVAVWQLWPRREMSGIAALVFGIVLSAVLWCACVYAMYAPIYVLGSSVG